MFHILLLENTCTHIPSSEDTIKKIKTLRLLLQLLVFQIFLLLPISLFPCPRFLLPLSPDHCPPQNNTGHVLAVQRE